MMMDLEYGLFKYEVKDYYSILGLPIDASAKDIRLRYLKIAYQLHPDTCQAETEEEKNKASQILSKLVNPAYENLYKDRLRKESQLIFAETGRRLADNAQDIPIATDTAKTLFNTTKNREKLYRELISKIATDQFQDINTASQKIALLSELNMVYLMLQNEKERRNNISRSASSAIQATEAIITAEPTINNSQERKQDNEPLNNQPETPVVDPTTAKIQRLMRNAEEAEKIGNIEQGILELREALKVDSNNSTVHAMIASLYLKQNNSTYAKIHLNKASSLNPNDPIVQKLKEDLNPKKTPENKMNKGKSTDKKSAKGKDGKKEAPKIFGISLW